MVASAQGEDRSSYQVPGASWGNLSFAAMKATEGLSLVDSAFAANWAEAKRQAKHRIAYHYWHPGLGATAQAEFFVNTVKSRGLEAGDVLTADIELTAGLDGHIIAADPVTAARRTHLLRFDADGRVTSRAGIVAHLLAFVGTRKFSVSETAQDSLDFLDAIHAQAPHNPVLIYTNRSIGATLGNCTHYPLWTAAPGSESPASVSPWTRWTFWQFAFGGGQVGSDQDAFNGTDEALQAWLDTFGTVTTPPPAKPPAAAPELRIADGKQSLEQIAAEHGRTVLDVIWATVRNTETPGPAQESYFGGLIAGTLTVEHLMPAGMRVWA